MPDFEAMYFTMFHQITQLITQLEGQVQQLKRMQIQLEQQYVEPKAPFIHRLPGANPDSSSPKL